MNNLPSLWPGEVASYDAVARSCTVRIPGITEGSTDLPTAVFNNALGDRASDTEIRILPGDLVWLMFEGGDPRFPIIMGYRTPRQGNPVDWRRWRHANIEMTADGKFVVNADEYIVNANTATINGETTVNGKTTINGHADITQGIGVTGGSSIAGALTNNGVNVGSTHVHTDPQGGNVGAPH